MKSKIPAVALFTAISFSLTSCGWIFGKKQSSKISPVEGKWSVSIIDSGLKHRNDMGLLTIAMSVEDTSTITAQFLPDSLLIFKNDTMHYYLDSAVQTIFVRDDSATIALNIKALTDSSLQLYAPADSLYYNLKRK